MKRFNVTVNGKAYDVQVEEVGSGAIAAAPLATAPTPAAPASAPPPIAVSAPAQVPSGEAGSLKIVSPMPGTILDIKASPGESVKRGQPIVILEAMKMENDIVAPEDGVVASINVGKGDNVNSGDILATLE